MPFPVAAAIVGGATLASSGIGAYSQGKMNKQNRAFAQEMWKKDADQNIAQWNMQNNYNEGMWDKQKAYNQSVWDLQNNYDSPAAQMERFRKAGLNPNLIYGQNNMGGTLDAAQNTPASAPAGAHSASVQGKAPQLDLASGIFSYMDFKTKQLQNDNLEAQNEAIRAGTARTLIDTDQIRTGIGLKEQLRAFREEANPLGLDALRLKNRQYEQQHEMKEKYYQMDTARFQQYLLSSRAQMQRMMSQNMTDTKQRQLMDTEINLSRMGIGKNSPWWIRAMGTQLANTEIFQPKADIDAPMKKAGIRLHKNPKWYDWGSFKFTND